MKIQLIKDYQEIYRDTNNDFAVICSKCGKNATEELKEMLSIFIAGHRMSETGTFTIENLSADIDLVDTKCSDECRGQFVIVPAPDVLLPIHQRLSEVLPGAVISFNPDLIKSNFYKANHSKMVILTIDPTTITNSDDVMRFIQYPQMLTMAVKDALYSVGTADSNIFSSINWIQTTYANKLTITMKVADIYNPILRALWIDKQDALDTVYGHMIYTISILLNSVYTKIKYEIDEKLKEN